MLENGFSHRRWLFPPIDKRELSDQFNLILSENFQDFILIFYGLQQIQVMKDDNEAFKGSPYLTSTRGRTPPLVTSNFVVQDDGK